MSPAAAPKSETSDVTDFAAALSSVPVVDIRVEGSLVGAALVTGNNNFVTVVYGAEVLRSRPLEALAAESQGALGPNPYRGLDAFDETSSHMFFGREELTAALLVRLARLAGPSLAALNDVSAPRLLAIMGPSGSGKSSVARAGLVPALARTTEPWLAGAEVVVLQPGAHPVDALAAALVRLASGDPTAFAKQREFADEIRAAAEAGRHDFLARFTATWRGGKRPPGSAAGGAPLVLLIDQFEETYTLCRPADPRDARQAAAAKAERDAFVGALLCAASEPGGRCSIVLTLRSDFYGALTAHPPLSKAVAASHEIVPAMDRADLRRAVAMPARAAGGAISSTAVERVLDEAEAGGSGAVLPLVQFTMFRVWEGMRGGVEAIETLASLRGVGGALAQRADEIMAALPSDAARWLARRAFLAAVQPGDEGARDTRRRAWLDEALPAGTREEEGRRILEPFVRERLLVVGAGAGAGEEESRRVWLELPHEAMIRHWRALASWVDAERDDLRFGRRAEEAAEAWRLGGRPRGALWRAPNLDLLRRYAARGQRTLTSLQEEFLAASDRQATRERLRAGSAIGAIAVLAVAAASLAWWSMQRTREAENERDRAFRAQVAALAGAADREVTQGDAVTALLLAVRPLLPSSRRASESVTAEAERAAYDALRRVQELVIVRGHADSIRDIAFSPDGRRLATASSDRTVRLWEPESGRELAVIRGHADGVTSLAFSPDGRRLATASSDRTVRLWEPESGRELAVIRGHEDEIASLAFSPDGRRLATASSDRTVRLWDVEGGQQVNVLRHNRNPGYLSVAFSPNGRQVAGGSSDGTTRLWDTESGQELAVLRGHEAAVGFRPAVFSVAFSPDGRRLATASQDRTVRLWEPESGRELAVIRGHEDAVTSLAFSPDGRRLATGSQDRTVRLWEMGSGVQLSVLRGHTGRIYQVSFSPSGQHLATASQDRTARLWDVDSRDQRDALQGHRGAVHFVAFSPDGQRLVTAGDDETARLWDRQGGRQLGMLRGHKGPITSVAFSPDGNRIATASWDRTAALWDAESGIELISLRGHTNHVLSVAFSLNGHRLVTAAQDGTVRVWDAQDGQALGVLLRLDRGWVSSLALSPDGQRLAATAFGSTWLWKAESERSPLVLIGHENMVNDAAFSSDGRRLATASGDGTVRVWEAESGRELAVLRGRENLAFSSLAFLPGGRRLVTGSVDGNVRILDVESGRELAVLRGHGAEINRVTLSPDGTLLASASNDRTVRLWPIYASRERLIAAAAARLPRCLSPAQLVLHGLAEPTEVDPGDLRQPEPPCW